MIDVKALRDAFERPSIKLADGTVVRGQILSHLQYLEWRDRLIAWKDLATDGAKAKEELRAFLTAIFSADVANAVMAERVRVQQEILKELIADFFACQEDLAEPTAAAPASS